MDDPRQPSFSKEEPHLTPDWLEPTLDALRDLISQRADGFILNILRDLHPNDIAELARNLTREERSYLYSLLDSSLASEVLLELNQPMQNEFVEQVDNSLLSEVIEEMDSDDATDLISGMPTELAEYILDSINEEDSAEVRELLKHEKDSAGGIMAKEFVALDQDMTVDQAIRKIRRMAEEIERIYNVFAINRNNQLVGTVPLQKLLLARPGIKVHHIMDQEVVCVRTDMDQEAVAQVFKKYDLVSIPVVDESGKMVGRITVDDIVDVIEDEASEDAQKIAGITEVDIRETSPIRLTRSRLPWLIIAFFGEIVTGILMSQFEATLKEAIYVAFFVPLIMAIGGNVGNQSAVVIIRGLATGEIGILEMGRRLRNELWVALMLGVVLATAILLIAGIWFGDYQIGVVISLALILVIINAALTGAILPFILKRVKIDPAVATSPFITTSNDILGLLIYFSMISAFLNTVR